MEIHNSASFYQFISCHLYFVTKNLLISHLGNSDPPKGVLSTKSGKRSETQDTEPVVLSLLEVGTDQELGEGSSVVYGGEQMVLYLTEEGEQVIIAQEQEEQTEEVEQEQETEVQSAVFSIVNTSARLSCE